MGAVLQGSVGIQSKSNAKNSAAVEDDITEFAGVSYI